MKKHQKPLDCTEKPLEQAEPQTHINPYESITLAIVVAIVAVQAGKQDVMSYDIWATVEPAPNRFTTYLDLGNMTSNVAPMWRTACSSLDGLAGIDGKTGAEVSAALGAGVRFMYKNRRKLEELNPENGWGSFPGAFRYFAAVAKAARDHPDAVFGVSR